jgi:RNA polymerase sigma-70 factor (ECF subfamily)
MNFTFQLSYKRLPCSGSQKLASRARRRIQGTESTSETAELKRKREVVDAFLTASRTGDFEKLLTVLDPNVILRNDTAFAPVAHSPVVHGSQAVSKQFAGRAQGAQLVLVNGSAGAVVAPRGQILFVLDLKVAEGKITEIEMIADQARLRQLDLAVLNDL